MKKKITSRILFACIAISFICLLGGKAMAGSTHEVPDKEKEETIEWIVKQIRSDNSGYASSYVAERLTYLINKDKYKIGSNLGIRDIDNSVITDQQTEKEINLMAAECKGYAKYVYFMLFGTFDGEKVYINQEGLHAGDHIRTNPIPKVDRNNIPYTLEHSLIYLCRDKDKKGSYFIDANWNLDNVIHLEHWTDEEFKAVFYNGFQTTQPKLYPRVGDYVTLAKTKYYNSPAELNSPGVIETGMVLHVSNFDTENITKNTQVKYENKLKNQISFRAILANAITPDGNSVWIVFNEPGALEYKGPLTSTDPTSQTTTTGLNSIPPQSTGGIIQTIWNAISSFFGTIIKPVHAASDENPESSSSNIDLNSSEIQSTPSSNVDLSETEVIEVPRLISPNNRSTYTGSTPTLQWSSISSPSGGQVKYYAETFDCPSAQSSGWITSTSWTPTSTAAGVYNWHVKAIDVNTGKESGYGSVWQYTLTSEYQPADKPSLLRPSNGSTYTGSTPTLQWSSISSPSGGQVKYYAETFDCPSAQSSGWITSTSWTPTSTAAGLYNWHVKAIDVNTGKESGYGNVWQYTLTSEYQPADKPSLLRPSNGSTYTGSTPTLQWSSISSPSGGQVKYYAETFDCPSAQSSGWITSTSWTPTSTAAGLYNWHVKAIDVNTGKESGYGNVWQYTLTSEYQPADKPSLLRPSNGSTYTGSTPTLQWSSISSPSGGQVKYYAETFDCPSAQSSGWITSTSWTPTSTAAGLYNWHVKAIDVNTGKESGYGNVWQYTLTASSNSSDLPLDIRIAKFGPYDAQDNYSDQTLKVREMILNNSVSIVASDSFFFPYGDPGSIFTKKLIIIYRNRWNEEWEVACNEGETITLTRDSQIGEFILDGDNP